MKDQDLPNVRVALAEDNPSFRARIRAMLDKTTDIQVVGEAGNGEDVISLVLDQEPEVLLLDIELPGLIDGVDIAHQLHASGSQVKVLVLSAYDDPYYIESVLKEGVAGYLIKDDIPGRLEDAIRDVARGGRGWFSAGIR